MLVPIATKVPVSRRDNFYALAHSLNTSPSALLRDLIDRCLDGDDNLHGMLKALGEDLTRLFVLTRFLAEQVDPDTTDELLKDTQLFLQGTGGRNAPTMGEIGHG